MNYAVGSQIAILKTARDIHPKKALTRKPVKNGGLAQYCKKQSIMNSAVGSQIAILKTARDIHPKKALAAKPVAELCETSGQFWTDYAKTLRHPPRIGTSGLWPHVPPQSERTLQTSFREKPRGDLEPLPDNSFRNLGPN